MGVLRMLLSIAVRGELKVGVTIITVALFTGVITATQNILSSYSVNAPMIEEIATQPVLLIHPSNNGEALEVEVADVLVDGVLAVMVSPSNITRYLTLMRARSHLKQLEEGEALVSADILTSTVNESLKAAGVQLKVAGPVEPFDALLRTLIVSPKTLKALDVEAESLYYDEFAAGSRGCEAPASISLIQGLTFEVQSLLSTIMYIMYASLEKCRFFLHVEQIKRNRYIGIPGF